MGCVYVMKNQGMPGLFKVGYTDRNHNQRERELSAPTGVPYPFSPILAVYFDYGREAEQAIKTMYDSSRVYSNKEFFRLNEEELEYFLDNVVTIAIALNNGCEFRDAIANAFEYGIAPSCSEAIGYEAFIINYAEKDIDIDIPQIIGVHPNMYCLLDKIQKYFKK